MLKLVPGVVVALPVNQLGVALLKDLVASGEWNEYNCVLGVQEAYRSQPRA